MVSKSKQSEGVEKIVVEECVCWGVVSLGVQKDYYTIGII
jgi:hypothetical protein